MTTFKIGDWVIPKNEVEREKILFYQKQSEEVTTFPCKVVAISHTTGNLNLVGVEGKKTTLWWRPERFTLNPPPDRSLEHYM